MREAKEIGETARGLVGQVAAQVADGEGDGSEVGENGKFSLTMNDLNRIVNTHVKRALNGLPKLVAAEIARKPASGASEFSANEELARLKQELADEKAQGRRSAAQRSAMTTLDGMGIKGPKARAVIAMLTESGQLQVDESGEAQLTVARQRVKNGPIEEQVFDLATGLADWCRTAEAADFLPAPTNKNKSQVRPPTRLHQPGPEHRWTDRELAQKMAADLEAHGVDIDASFDAGGEL